MAAILEMPQYVAYQKNVVYAFIKLSAKYHSFNILRTMVVLAALLLCLPSCFLHAIAIFKSHSCDSELCMCNHTNQKRY